MKKYVQDFIEGALLASALFFAVVAANSLVSSAYAQFNPKGDNDHLCILATKSCVDNGCRESSTESVANKCAGVYGREGLLEDCKCAPVGS